jgi:hypothetical protein
MHVCCLYISQPASRLPHTCSYLWNMNSYSVPGFVIGELVLELCFMEGTSALVNMKVSVLSLLLIQ